MDAGQRRTNSMCYTVNRYLLYSRTAMVQRTKSFGSLELKSKFSAIDHHVNLKLWFATHFDWIWLVMLSVR